MRSPTFLSTCQQHWTPLTIPSKLPLTSMTHNPSGLYVPLGFCSKPFFLLILFSVIALTHSLGFNHKIVEDAPKFFSLRQLLSWVQIPVTSCPVGCFTGTPASLSPAWMFHGGLPLPHSLRLLGSRTIIHPVVQGRPLFSVRLHPHPYTQDISFLLLLYHVTTNSELKQHRCIILQV